MKNPVGPAAFIAALLAVASVVAQNDSGTRTTSPGPQNTPAPNINTGGSPTAPAQMPTEAGAASPSAPTFPAGRNQPPSRGGTIGHDPELDDEEDQEKRRRARRRRERSVKEPSSQTHTSDPLLENPGALEGGPQP